MKKIFKVLICGILAISLTGCGSNKTSPSNGDDSVISLTKNNFKVTANDLYNTLKEKYATNYLIQEIDKNILDDKYETNSETNEYVENQIKMYQMMYGNSEQQLLEALQSAGYQDLNEFKSTILLNYKRELATKDYEKAKITDKDIQKYYENDVYGDITLRHILVSLDITDTMTDEEKNEALEKANSKIKEIYEKLDSGTDFKEVAKEYSDDSATKEDGGLVGTFNKQQMIEKFNTEIDDAVVNLNVGSYTKKAVKSSYGYHILYKEAQKDKPKLEEVKDTIIDTLVEKAMDDDAKAQYKAMIELREEYGLTFNDDDVKKQYDNAVNNWLYGKES